MSTPHGPNRTQWWVAAIPIAFLAFFFFYPLTAILAESLRGGEILSRLGSSATWRVVRFTFLQATISTVATLVAGLPLAYLFSHYRFPGRRLLRAIATVPFVLPTVVVGSAFLALLGPGGWLGKDASGTLFAIIAAHVFYNTAVVLRTVGALWERLDPRLGEAARALGAGPLRRAWSVTLPLLRPALAAAASLVFLFSFTSFGVVLILGGLRYRTLEVEIYRQTFGFLDLGAASVLALIQLGVVAVTLLFYVRFQQRTSTQTMLRSPIDVAHPLHSLRSRGAVAGILGMAGVLIGLPLAALVTRSFQSQTGLSLQAYRALGEAHFGDLAAPIQSITNSLVIGAVATLIALGVGIPAAVAVSVRARAAGLLDALIMLPLGASAVTIGFGLLLALDYPIDLRTSRLLVPIAQALVAIPFVVRLVVPVLRSIRSNLREAAAVLGASPTAVMRKVDLPLVGRALGAAAGFAFLVSMGEFGATLFLARPEFPTLPLSIARLLSRPGTFPEAMAMGTILAVISASAILMIDRIAEPREF